MGADTSEHQQRKASLGMVDLSLVAALCLISFAKVQIFTFASGLVFENVYIGNLKGSEYDAFVDFCVVVVDVLILWWLHVVTLQTLNSIHQGSRAWLPSYKDVSITRIRQQTKPPSNTKQSTPIQTQPSKSTPKQHQAKQPKQLQAQRA